MVAFVRQTYTTHVVFLLWLIWKERCNCVFNHISPNSLSVASRAFRASSEFLTIPTFLSPKIHRPRNSEDSTHWFPPPIHSWKINTDAAWDSSTLSCGLSALLRDSTGTLVKGLSQLNSASSSLAAEAMAIDLGLSLASSIPLSSFQLESDSLVLISAF
ncbi:putative ribonuclease H-like domain-containing protein [Rosa chinensis]|uniref:Putative ribonuclease H-like domain-containing protein n=1 Tax=Rosa chinensis TaxID=74649 RepID=A0A2P6S9C4_ROSCH|nr:putative ribonuclease H-like domain-containing protein [Rosa chinensis]